MRTGTRIKFINILTFLLTTSLLICLLPSVQWSTPVFSIIMIAYAIFSIVLLYNCIVIENDVNSMARMVIYCLSIVDEETYKELTNRESAQK